MNYNTIVTHENPDLDAILSSLLLKLFGEKKFPGVTTAKMEFVSAGTLYKGERSQKLLEQGIITVDTGGGQFDTHPDDNNKVDRDKLNRSASDLVAEYLGVIDDPKWNLLIEPFGLDRNASRSPRTICSSRSDAFSWSSRLIPKIWAASVLWPDPSA